MIGDMGSPISTMCLDSRGAYSPSLRHRALSLSCDLCVCLPSMGLHFALADGS